MKLTKALVLMAAAVLLCGVCSYAEVAPSTKVLPGRIIGQKTLSGRDLTAKGIYFYEGMLPSITSPQPVPQVGKNIGVACNIGYAGTTGIAGDSYSLKLVVDGAVISERAGISLGGPIGNSGVFGAGWTPASAGAHTIVCTVDSKNQIAETNETNNRATLTVQVAAAAPGGQDLIATSVRLFDGLLPTVPGSPQPTPQVGKSVGIACDIGYAGATGISGDAYSVKMEVDGVVLQETAAGFGLGGPAGSAGVYGARWTPATMGPHTIVCTVDSKNQIAESNETNNSATLTVQVVAAAPGGQDLIASGVRLFDSFLPPPPGAPQPTAQVGKNIGVVCDIGYMGTTGISGSSYSVKLTVDGVVISEGAGISFGGSSGTSSGVFGARWTPATAGTHTIVCTVDSKNQIAETNETNNMASLVVQVQQ
jgi:subtilase family serine protease